MAVDHHRLDRVVHKDRYVVINLYRNILFGKFQPGNPGPIGPPGPKGKISIYSRYLLHLFQVVLVTSVLPENQVQLER